MTTVVLVSTKDSVYLAADHKECADSLRRPDVHKVVNIGNWIAGGAGDVIHINNLLAVLKRLDADASDIFELQDQLRKVVKDLDLDTSGLELDRGASILAVAVRNGKAFRLIELDLDKDGVNLNELSGSSDKQLDMYAIGSGGNIAIGVLHGRLSNIKKAVKMSKEIEAMFTIVSELDIYTSSGHDIAILNKDAR